MKTNKKKIINDPVFGFITIQSDFIFDLIEHPYFQRLRRIKQLGLSCAVFPGANHTRFEHAIGATYLMRTAINSLRLKGVVITNEEAEAVSAAILLHDIGHGPFSHALEHSIVEGVPHEGLSALLMKDLNDQFNGKLELAIQIFNDEYPKKFLHQLVASQLDMDRLDYLRRDSFFAGVAEGTVGADRIIKMLNVKDDELVVEYKGIYSVEKFLISRRLMYWQVYLHKTVLSAEYLLVNILRRAKELVLSGGTLYAPPALQVFLENKIRIEQFASKDTYFGKSLLELFTELDDNDLISAIKQWMHHEDRILAYLSDCLINRKLFGIMIQNRAFSKKKIEDFRRKVCDWFKIDKDQSGYLLVTDSITNNAYMGATEKINILLKNGKVKEINEASDINLSSLSQTVRKYFICYPKELDIN